MQSGPDADEQKRRKWEAIHETARKLAPESSDAGISPWTLRRIESLEAQNQRLQVRVDHLEEKTAESITPRFPHDGPPPSRAEWRGILRSHGWDKTADLL